MHCSLSLFVIGTTHMMEDTSIYLPSPNFDDEGTSPTILSFTFMVRPDPITTKKRFLVTDLQIGDVLHRYVFGIMLTCHDLLGLIPWIVAGLDCPAMFGKGY